MKVYVKNKNERRWHWVFGCPKYPEGSKVDKSYKSPGEKLLCPYCKQIEAEGKRKSKVKEILNDDNLHYENPH